MDKFQIYLCGAMGGLTFEESNKWREESRLYFTTHEYNKITCVNPNDYYNFKTPTHKSEHEVKEFDLYKLKHSDLVLANLDHINTSIGSAMELQVAHDNNIPIITFGDITDIHPWIIDTIWRNEDVLDDACDYIINYFLYENHWI